MLEKLNITLTTAQSHPLGRVRNIYSLHKTVILVKCQNTNIRSINAFTDMLNNRSSDLDCIILTETSEVLVTVILNMKILY